MLYALYKQIQFLKITYGDAGSVISHLKIFPDTFILSENYPYAGAQFFLKAKKSFQTFSFCEKITFMQGHESLSADPLPEESSSIATNAVHAL